MREMYQEWPAGSFWFKGNVYRAKSKPEMIYILAENKIDATLTLKEQLNESDPALEEWRIVVTGRFTGNQKEYVCACFVEEKGSEGAIMAKWIKPSEAKPEIGQKVRIIVFSNDYLAVYNSRGLFVVEDYGDEEEADVYYWQELDPYPPDIQQLFKEASEGA